MDSSELLATPFEENRGYLRSVAYRMLGSLSEADDAVQETWLRLSRSDAEDIENLRGWLTTVVARVCLDMLRSRQARREQSLEAEISAHAPSHNKPDPEQEALLADSVGLALLVVLDRLNPAERLAFVLHDLFALSFDQIGPLVGRSPTAARQLASRARRRVQGVTTIPDVDLAGHRKVVENFLAALRAGDLEGLLGLLDSEFVIEADEASLPAGAAAQKPRSARAWAEEAITYSKGARFAQPALVNGSVGLVLAPRGRLVRALTFGFKNGKIARIDVIGDRARLQKMDLAVLQ